MLSRHDGAVDLISSYERILELNVLKQAQVDYLNEIQIMPPELLPSAFISSSEPKAHSELIVYPCSGFRPSSVVRPSSTISLKPLGRLFSYNTYTIYR